MTTDNDSIVSLGYDIDARLRYSHDPNLRLNEFSRRQDVRRVRHLIPRVPGIGPVTLDAIDAWLGIGRRSVTSRLV